MGLRGGGINLGLKPKSFSLALLENCLEEGILEMVLWARQSGRQDRKQRGKMWFLGKPGRASSSWWVDLGMVDSATVPTGLFLALGHSTSSQNSLGAVAALDKYKVLSFQVFLCRYPRPQPPDMSPESTICIPPPTEGPRPTKLDGKSKNEKQIPHIHTLCFCTQNLLLDTLLRL